MKICENFYTLQGEGKYVGEPSYFIRTSGCILRCKFCDTKHSWDIHNGLEISDKDDISKFCSNNLNNLDKTTRIVFTGGEPLMYNNLDIIFDMIEHFRSVGFYRFMFETTMIFGIEDFMKSNLINNLLFLKNLLLLDEDICFSVSPKLNLESYVGLNVKEEDVFSFYLFGLNSIDRLINTNFKDNIFFKLVYQKETEQSILKFIDRVPYEYFRESFYLMPYTPVPYNSDRYLQSKIDCFEFCKKNSVRYSPRIHVDIFQLQREK